jgi:hypothetical protein
MLVRSRTAERNRKNAWTLAIVLFVCAFAATGCPTTDKKFAGQRCLDDSECAEGLRCSERTCVPESTGGGEGDDAGEDAGVDMGRDLGGLDIG